MLLRLVRRGASTGDAGLMEQAGRRGRRSGQRTRRRAPGEIRAFAGAAPGCLASSAGTRAASGLRPEAISSCQELADRRKCRESAARRRKEDTAAERREARRPAIRPVISERSRRSTLSRGGSPGVALPHQRLSALCSPHFFRERKRTKGIRLPLRTGRRRLAV
jgi:hypothetical protein